MDGLMVEFLMMMPVFNVVSVVDVRGGGGVVRVVTVEVVGFAVVVFRVMVVVSGVVV